MIQAIPSRDPSPTPAVTHLPVVDRYLRVFHINDNADDQIIFQAACRFGQVPFNWHVADSVEKGISYLKTLVAQSKQLAVCWPDLILLDLVLPSTTGFEVLKFIRATPELKHLPVVVFTGHDIPENRAQSLALGANDFLLKSANFQEIVSMAQKLYALIRQMKPDGSLPLQAG